jgi:hypothetical protein
LSEEEKLLISGACGLHNAKAKKIKEKLESQVKKWARDDPGDWLIQVIIHLYLAVMFG